jgi:menaquinone-dependent protoporphyrinogen oxidase
MTILVAAASKHGATAEIADWLGAALARNGIVADVRRLDDVSDLEPYDGFVLGSAVYLGQWLRTARRFVDDHAGALAGRPTWLFSSGPVVGDPPPPEDPRAVQPALVETLLETTHAREHRVFGGKVDESTLSWCEKIATRCAHAHEGDYRDRQAVVDWADAIAREIRRDRVGSER